MNQDRKIGFELKTLHNLIGHYFESVRSTPPMDSITRMQGWIIGYLGKQENQGQSVFQKDVENQFAIRRSTATGILQLMEKNGLLIRESVEQDARLKKLVLTPKAREIHAIIIRDMQRMEQVLSSGITDQEKQAFFAVLDKIKANLEQEAAEKPKS